MTMNNRIAFISDHASPLSPPGSTDCGGQNVYVAETAKLLAEMGYQVDIFTRRETRDTPRVINWVPGVRVIHLDAGPAESIPKEEILVFMEEFRDNLISFIIEGDVNYKLIHAHFFMSGWVAAELKKVLNIPFVITFHALGHVRKIHQQDKDRFPARRLQIEESVVKAADRIIAECPQDKSDLMTFYRANQANITVVPCGFNPDEFHPVLQQDARRLLGLNENDFIILQLGRMVPRKGIDNLIKSMNMLKSGSRTVKLLVVGGETDNDNLSASPELQRLIQIANENGVADKVSFVGRKSRNQLRYYYSAADVFVTTPWYEPFGITPLEAMACGVPVIGSDVGGIKFSVVDGETGFLVPPNNPEALAHKISVLINDRKLLGEMRVNALMRVNTHFKWKNVSMKLSEIYTETIKRGAGRKFMTRTALNDTEAA